MNSKITPEEKNNGRHIKAKVIAMAITACAIMALVIISAAFRLHANYHVSERDIDYMQLQIALTAVNVILLTILLSEFVENYIKFRTRFTLGFILLAIVMISDNISSSPLFFAYFGYSPMQGPFLLVPTIFTFFTTIALFYLNER